MIWSNWHKNYEVSPRLKARLHLVQGQIDGALIAAAPGPIRILSICAGDGRDLLGLRPDHPRRPDIVAYLVDNDFASLERGRQEAAQIQFPGQLHFVEADATQIRSYQGLGHFDLVLISGFWGICVRRASLRSSPDYPYFVATMAGSCGTVIWC
jgi:hypothetical protein